MTEFSTFEHPDGAFTLRYPPEWTASGRDGRWTFGPEGRDDVKLTVTLLPFRFDTERMDRVLGELVGDWLAPGGAINVRRDPTLRYPACKADAALDRDKGHHWLVAGGDLLLFASSAVPAHESGSWSRVFDAVMKSLTIPQDEVKQRRRLCRDLLDVLREHDPDHPYTVDEDGIRGQGHVIRVHNLHRRVLSEPERREEILLEFALSLLPRPGAALGSESWEDARSAVLPALKHVSYFRTEGPTSFLVQSEWLPEVRIAYAIRHGGRVRFVHREDLKRWGCDLEELHERALQNLGNLSWPDELPRRRRKDGRLIAIREGDGFEASRILHPRFHELLRAPLGSPFLAAIPDRDTLIAFTDRAELREQIARRVARDHARSAYPITDRIFRVTPDGVAPADGTDVRP